MSRLPLNVTRLRVVPLLALQAAAGWGYMRYLDRHSTVDIPLTAEARTYTRNLQLSDVEMKARENYFPASSRGDRGKNRQHRRPAAGYGGDLLRLPRSLRAIGAAAAVGDRQPRMGGLKPGETKSFRLPFDDLPASWNQAMPQLVIAGVKFS